MALFSRADHLHACAAAHLCFAPMYSDAPLPLRSRDSTYIISARGERRRSPESTTVPVMMPCHRVMPRFAYPLPVPPTLTASCPAAPPFPSPSFRRCRSECAKTLQWAPSSSNVERKGAGRFSLTVQCILKDTTHRCRGAMACRHRPPASPGGLRRPVNNPRGKPLILTVACATWGKPR